MSGYGFGKKSVATSEEEGRLDLSGITRAPLLIDPAREAAALERGAALGYVDRGAEEETIIRRRRQATPQSSVYIKGPKDTLDWFIDYTNRRAHRSYWQTIKEFREIIEARDANEDLT